MQLLFVDRFRQIIVHARTQQFLLLPRHRVRRHGNHRRLLLVRKLANQLAGADAIHARHLNIHQDQVELHLFGLFHGFGAAGTQLNVLNLILKQHANQLQVRRVIVHGHHRHRQLMFVVFQRQGLMRQTAIFGQRR